MILIMLEMDQVLNLNQNLMFNQLFQITILIDLFYI